MRQAHDDTKCEVEVPELRGKGTQQEPDCCEGTANHHHRPLIRLCLQPAAHVRAHEHEAGAE